MNAWKSTIFKDLEREHDGHESGRAERARELRSEASHRWLRNEVQEAVHPEDQEDEAEKDASDESSGFISGILVVVEKRTARAQAARTSSVISRRCGASSVSRSILPLRRPAVPPAVTKCVSVTPRKPKIVRRYGSTKL